MSRSCAVCDGKIDLHGRDGTRCARCKEPCPTCEGDAMLCAHPLMTTTPQTGAAEEGLLVDDFRGDNGHLIRCIEALISLSDSGTMVPHGIGGHARSLLSAAAIRLARTPTITPAGQMDAIERARVTGERLIEAAEQADTPRSTWTRVVDDFRAAITAIQGEG